jgi:hypothetical protein
MDRRLERRKCSPYVLFPTAGDLPQYFCRMMECWDPYTCESKNLCEEIKKSRNVTRMGRKCRTENVVKHVEKHIEISRHIVKSVYSDVVKHIGRQVVKCFIDRRKQWANILGVICAGMRRGILMCVALFTIKAVLSQTLSLSRDPLYPYSFVTIPSVLNPPANR